MARSLLDRADAAATDAAAAEDHRPAMRELVPHDPRHSARWHQHDYPGVFARWNYHPEYELHLARRQGQYIVGGSVGHFEYGQLVLVGPNVPHEWLTQVPPGEVLEDSDVVLQFRHEWLQECELLLPELGELNELWGRARFGVEFTGAAAADGARLLDAVGAATGMDRLLSMLDLFRRLAQAPEDEYRLLTDGWTPQLNDPHAQEIIGRALNYVSENLTGDVRLSVAARLAGMSESAFSRYFTRASGQNFAAMVRRLRIAHATKLLLRTSLPVAQIAHQVGYANLSNFNRQFRRETGRTPTAYRRAAG
ncbi:AraC family transcriptional regulator [Zhihengliuella sp.]|uniref:AraC family transcriptional regulator n=1 Tax=Zhihengliuella sp. TaxID=1954483 RepID=UPI002810D1FF|nr:AraC family transcriptional regulator [Zhihengliuella sp.]